MIPLQIPPADWIHRARVHASVGGTKMNYWKPDEIPLQVLMGVRVGSILVALFCLATWSLTFWQWSSALFQGPQRWAWLMGWQLWLIMGLMMLVGPWAKPWLTNFAVSHRGIALYRRHQQQEFTPWTEISSVDWEIGQKRTIQRLVLKTSGGKEYRIQADTFDVRPLLELIKEHVDSSRISQSAKSAPHD
jgi:hypothetical protein